MATAQFRAGRGSRTELSRGHPAYRTRAIHLSHIHNVPVLIGRRENLELRG